MDDPVSRRNMFLVSKEIYTKAELLSHFTSKDLPDSVGKVSTKANSAVTPKRLLPQESQSRPIAIKKLIWRIPTPKSSLKKRYTDWTVRFVLKFVLLALFLIL